MTKQSKPASHEERPHEETVTPFLERSITELIRLFAQLFTTPFAFLTFNKRFRDQIVALAKDDLETAYPETVARPLTFFVLMMGAHFLLSGIYWRMAFPAKSLKEMLSSTKAGNAHEFLTNQMAKMSRFLTESGFFEKFAGYVGGHTEALMIIAATVTLIIAVKAYFVSMAGYLFRCPVRLKSALHASAYGFGTFIFFQYVLILVRFLAGQISDGPGFQYGYGLVVYGSLALAVLLVVRVNQTIRQADGTAELPTYATWIVGTAAWQFVIVFGANFLLASGSLADYWNSYATCWRALGIALSLGSLLHP